MFTLEQIRGAHSHVKSGADFPVYIQTLKDLGVKQYTVFVEDGHTEYHGDAESPLFSDPLYQPLTIANVDHVLFKELLQNHQKGETNYSTFCQDAARSGVEKWTVTIGELTCTYLNKGKIILIENIA